MLSKPIHLSETEENGISYVGAAWLSSARVVRCLVKSYNERNPRFVLLRHAPKEKVFAAKLARLTKKIERAFLAWLVKSSFWPYLTGDDDVELTAEKDWAFRRAARWTASDILEEGGDDVKSPWPLWVGPHTCYNGNYNGKQGCKAEQIRKDCLSSNCSLQLGNMKLESLALWYGVKGSVYVVTLPAFQRFLEDGPDAAERRPESEFPTGEGERRRPSQGTSRPTGNTG
nr:ribosomal protein S10 [Tanacetum cinerariifolium]